jgi:exosome complex component RRP42
MSAAVAATSAPVSAVPTISTGAGVLHTFASSRLSSSELSYLASGVASNLRADGRARLDYRPLTLQTSVVAHANGSARLKLEQTDVLVAVNMSMTAPDLTKARCEGSVQCSVEQSAACCVDQEERDVQARNFILTAELQRLLAHSHALPLASLVIVPDKQVWVIHIDVLIIENGGNLMDAIVMAVKAALVTTTMPPIEVVTGQHTNTQIAGNNAKHRSRLPSVLRSSLCVCSFFRPLALCPRR